MVKMASLLYGKRGRQIPDEVIPPAINPIKVFNIAPDNKFLTKIVERAFQNKVMLEAKQHYNKLSQTGNCKLNKLEKHRRMADEESFQRNLARRLAKYTGKAEQELFTCSVAENEGRRNQSRKRSNKALKLNAKKLHALNNETANKNTKSSSPNSNLRRRLAQEPPTMTRIVGWSFQKCDNTQIQRPGMILKMLSQTKKRPVPKVNPKNVEKSQALVPVTNATSKDCPMQSKTTPECTAKPQNVDKSKTKKSAKAVGKKDSKELRRALKKLSHPKKPEGSKMIPQRSFKCKMTIVDKAIDTWKHVNILKYPKISAVSKLSKLSKVPKFSKLSKSSKVRPRNASKPATGGQRSAKVSVAQLPNFGY